MATSNFDARVAARKLKTADVERSQAEVVTKVVRDGRGDLATKADITRVEDKVTKLVEDVAGVKTDVAGVKADVATLDAKVEANFAEMKTELKYLKWILGTLTAALLVYHARVLSNVSLGL